MVVDLEAELAEVDQAVTSGGIEYGGGGSLLWWRWVSGMVGGR